MKIISCDHIFENKLSKGANALANIVSKTLGPKGKNVILQTKNGKPILTKDGVSICRMFELEDPLENLGAMVLKQAAESTVSSAGDGTTTSIVLANAIINKSLPLIAAGISPVELKKGIEKCCADIVSFIKEKSKPISSLDEIEQIATISSNNDKFIGSMLRNAVDKIGRDGSITIQESRSSETSIELSEGFSFDSGLIANAFINEERKALCRLENCLCLITDQSITTIDELLPVLEIVARNGSPFVIIAEQIEGQALAALIMNSMKGNMKICAVKAPKYGEERRNILSDLCLVSGATFISRESGIGLKQIKLSHLGKMQCIESSKYSSTIICKDGDVQKISLRIESLREMIKQTEDIQECQKIQDRLSKLSSGIAIIKVGGQTEVEMIEKKHRIEDALEAVSSAQEEGIVPGGGLMFLRASNSIFAHKKYSKNEALGYSILKDAICEPFNCIVRNAGFSPEILQNNVFKNKKYEFGIDALSGKVVNMNESGIIDPTKVVRSALENGVSAAIALLMTDGAIVEK